METYAMALNIAIPVFVLLMLIEMLVAKWKGKEYTYFMDSISSLSSGITNITKDVLGLAIVVVSYSWLVKHMALFNPGEEWYVYVLAFVGKDFAGYWTHRMDHRINVFWNRHIIHHSSEEYNLACALRQSASEILSFGALFLIPMALLGVPAKVFAIIAPLHLFLQFWYHTRLIDRMGFLEKIIMTPSHHRVHHAINPEYLDKNYAPIFIWWDKWFGTFQEELESVPPVYGVKRPVHTWNPLLINFQHMALLFQDAWRTRNLWDKIRIWFMPTGWRPADVAAQYPVEVLDRVYEQKKYAPPASALLQTWSFIQLIVTLTLSLYLFNHLGQLSWYETLFYGGFIFYSVFCYTTLMDRKKYAWILETIRLLLGGAVVVYTRDWFGLIEVSPVLPAALLLFYTVSALASMYFVKFDFSKDKTEAKAAGAWQM